MLLDLLNLQHCCTFPWACRFVSPVHELFLYLIRCHCICISFTLSQGWGLSGLLALVLYWLVWSFLLAFLCVHAGCLFFLKNRWLCLIWFTLACLCKVYVFSVECSNKKLFYTWWNIYVPILVMRGFGFVQRDTDLVLQQRPWKWGHKVQCRRDTRW